MKCSINRDKYVLSCILKNQQKIQKVLKEFNCDFSQTQKSVIYNEFAFDLCAMYMAQIGENVKLLTEESKQEISKIIDINTLRYFRNIIDHDYEKINKILLQPYIQAMSLQKSINIVKEQYKNCNVSKKRQTHNDQEIEEREI